MKPKRKHQETDNKALRNTETKVCLVSTDDEPDDTEIDYDRVNPANGLPMYRDMNIDVAGNIWGEDGLEDSFIASSETYVSVDYLVRIDELDNCFDILIPECFD